jgi:hypothetical protein
VRRIPSLVAVRPAADPRHAVGESLDQADQGKGHAALFVCLEKLDAGKSSTEARCRRLSAGLPPSQ